MTNTYIATVTGTILNRIFAPYMPATGAGSDPTLLIVTLVIATLAIIGGVFLLRRKSPK